MSTDDKNKDLDPEVETAADDAAQTDDQTIEDAEVIAEIPAEADETAGDADDYEEMELETSPDDVDADNADEDAAEEAVDADEVETKTETDDPDLVDGPVEDATDAQAPEDDRTEDAPVADTPAEPAPAPAASGAGVMSTVFGGVLAAIVGFGSAQFIDVDWMDMTGLGTDPMAQAVSGNSDQIAALSARLAEIEAAAKDTTVVEGIMTGIAAEMTASFGTVQGELSALAAQVGAVEGGVSDRVSAVDATLSGAQEQFSAVEGELARMTEAFDTIGTRIARLGDNIASVETRLVEVDERLVAVEKRPLVESSDTAKAAFESYERQLEELRGILNAQRVDAEELEASMTDMSAAAAAQMTAVKEQAEEQLLAVRNQTEMELQAVRDNAAAQVAGAEAAAAAAIAAAETRAAEAEAQADAKAQLAVAQASLSQVEAALNAGIPYEVALPALAAVATVPEVIAANGSTGIPTVLQLQEGFTPVARAALDASIKGTMSEDPGNRLMAFLRTQTGVRSLEARAGNDPDAVLSRMALAVEAGDLSTALSEVATLPQDGQAALASWTTAAQARLDAEAALPALAATVNNS